LKRPLPDNTHHSQDTLCPRGNSNPQSQQASEHGLTPYTARPPGSALFGYLWKFVALKRRLIQGGAETTWHLRQR